MFRSHPMSFLKNTQIWAKSGFAPKNLKNTLIVMKLSQKLYFNVFYRLKKNQTSIFLTIGPFSFVLSFFLLFKIE